MYVLLFICFFSYDKDVNSFKRIIFLQILIDGSPLKNLDTQWFRERIGYVGQVMLFSRLKLPECWLILLR